jgi:hypothetical protein
MNVRYRSILLKNSESNNIANINGTKARSQGKIARKMRRLIRYLNQLQVFLQI